MTLTTCLDCGHGLSAAAAACPHCGRPSAAEAYPGKSLGLIATVAGVCAAFFGLLPFLGVLLGVPAGLVALLTGALAARSGRPGSPARKLGLLGAGLGLLGVLLAVGFSAFVYGLAD